jgi:hypothetical protein
MGHYVPMKKEGSMRHDELWDMGHFVPMKKEVY